MGEKDKNKDRRKEEKESKEDPYSLHETVHGFVWIYFDVFVVIESYIHVITEQGPRSILEPTLMGSAVQNARKHQVQRQLLLHRGIIEAPAPAATVRGWEEEKPSAEHSL